MSVSFALLTCLYAHRPHQYTVTMFLVDVSPSMGETRVVDVPDGPNGQTRTTEMTHLEWALQFVMLKVQEMVRLSISLPLRLSRVPRPDLQWKEDRQMRRRALRHRGYVRSRLLRVPPPK